MRCEGDNQADVIKVIRLIIIRGAVRIAVMRIRLDPVAPAGLMVNIVAESLLHRLAEADADVFDRVVRIDLQVSFGFDLEIECSMPREQLEHVVEEADTGLPGAGGRAIEVELEVDLRFAGGAVDG